MRVIITGGAGFIGSNLIHYLLGNRKDWDILNFDALTYAGNLENLAKVSDSQKYKFFQGDVTIANDVERAMEEFKPDAIMHLAAESHVDRSILDPLAFVRTNVIGTQIVLDSIRKLDKSIRLLHVSTDEVYGSLGSDGYFVENTPLAPNSPYSSSKASSDLFVRAAFKTHGLNVVTTRCSNNYGPYQFPEKLIPLMISNAEEDKSLPVYGDGLQIRDWLHVEDHCIALTRVLEKGKTGDVYNIGGHNEWANINIVKLILSTLNKPDSLIKYVTDRPGHDRRYAIDATKIEKELGWIPSRTFEEGLPETIKWYLENKDWVKNVQSGAYREFYEEQYGHRLKNQ